MTTHAVPEPVSPARKQLRQELRDELVVLPVNKATSSAVEGTCCQKFVDDILVTLCGITVHSPEFTRTIQSTDPFYFDLIETTATARASE